MPAHLRVDDHLELLNVRKPAMTTNLQAIHLTEISDPRLLTYASMFTSNY